MTALLDQQWAQLDGLEFSPTEPNYSSTSVQPVMKPDHDAIRKDGDLPGLLTMHEDPYAAHPPGAFIPINPIR